MDTAVSRLREVPIEPCDKMLTEGIIMVDATAKFFADLESGGHQPLLEKASGSLRFELTEGKAVERWRVDVRKGDVAVSHKAGAADCVLRAPKSLFDKIASGRENAMAAVLRGALVVEGNIDLLLAFQRILPGPPRRAAARSTSGHQPERRVAMADDLVKILDGNTFVVSDNRGDIEASLTDPTGLFSFDTRFLSKWVLTIDGDRLNPLSVDDMQYFESRFFLVPGTGTVYVDANLSVIRRRSVGAGFEEEIAVLNHDNQPVKLAIRIDAGCDFADLFEVKDALRKKGKFSTRVERSRLVLEYTRDTYRRYTTIAASEPAKYDEKGLAFAVTIPAHGEWKTTIDVTTGPPDASRRSDEAPAAGRSPTCSAISTAGSKPRPS